MKSKFIFPKSLEQDAEKVFEKLKKEGEDFMAKYRRKWDEIVEQKSK